MLPPASWRRGSCRQVSALPSKRFVFSNVLIHDGASNWVPAALLQEVLVLVPWPNKPGVQEEEGFELQVSD